MSSPTGDALTVAPISEERLRNTRSWAAARPDMSGSSVIVGAIDELLQRRAAEPPPVPLYDRDKYPTACLAAEAFIDEYLDGYEMVGEDAEGREGAYMPNSHEDALIRDAIAGLHGDEDFVTLIGAEYVERQARRAAEGACLTCSAPAGQHWGRCSAVETGGSRT